jgi:hypothetical protein
LVYAVTAPVGHFLRWYLVVQIVYVPIVFCAYKFFSNLSITFCLVYSVCTLPCLLAALILCLYALTDHPAPGYPFLAAPFIAGIFFLMLMTASRHSGRFSFYITAVETTTLIFAGTMIGLSAPFQIDLDDRIPAFTLAFLWICQAGFRLIYILHEISESWEIANQVVPPMLMVAASGWLGWSRRRAAVSC